MSAFAKVCVRIWVRECVLVCVSLWLCLCVSECVWGVGDRGPVAANHQLGHNHAPTRTSARELGLMNLVKSSPSSILLLVIKKSNSTRATGTVSPVLATHLAWGGAHKGKGGIAYGQHKGQMGQSSDKLSPWTLKKQRH